MSATTGAKHLTFYRQPARPASALDPAHGYLPYAQQATERPAGTGTLLRSRSTQSGQTATFMVTVSG